MCVRMFVWCVYERVRMCGAWIRLQLRRQVHLHPVSERGAPF